MVQLHSELLPQVSLPSPKGGEIGSMKLPCRLLRRGTFVSCRTPLANKLEPLLVEIACKMDGTVLMYRRRPFLEKDLSCFVRISARPICSTEVS